MADIFISYARADRPRAETLAAALHQTGWSVWWDREIPPGRSFDEVIEEALSQASCVVVIWSEASVRSEWVKTEAAEAAARRILVPILADSARIPLEFRRTQAAVIDQWDDLVGNDAWPQFRVAVAALVGVAQPRVPARAPRTRQPSRFPRPRATVAVAGAVGVAMIASAVAILVWPSGSGVPTAAMIPATPAASVAAYRTPPPDPAPLVSAEPSAEGTARAGRAPEWRRRAAASVRLPHGEARPTHVTRPDAEGTVESSNAPADVPATSAPAAAVERAHTQPEPVPETRAASFEVALVYGVFRDQTGRLEVSDDGLRFQGPGGRTAFDVSCAAVRRVTTATMIADREQRLLEVTAAQQNYRLRAVDTGARDRLLAAIGRSCGRS